MTNTLFSQSDLEEPYKLYEGMLNENAVYWDSINKIWAIYSYEDCKTILKSNLVHIPEISKDGLNEYALLMTAGFTRLANDTQHEVSREAAMLLFNKMKPVAIDQVIESLLADENNKKEMDWVNVICKKLPALIVLKSFGFSQEDCDFIKDKIEQLSKIMLPSKTPKQVQDINEVAKEIYDIVEKYLLNEPMYNTVIDALCEKYKMQKDKIVSLCVSNLIGLSVIQGYDANRGLLSNSMLQILYNCNSSSHDGVTKEYLRKSVTETLRFDPPVHNTKRLATNNIAINNTVIKKNEKILVVLAAANRDPVKFRDPNVFDIERSNNRDHLTFGFGGHACMANHFAANLATDTLLYFFNQHKKINLIDTNILYEPTVNVRLPKKFLISFS